MEKSVDPDKKHRFFKVLLEEDETRLRIPEAFYPRISRESQSCERAVVQGPSGAYWVIKVYKSRDGGIYLEKGWEVFVQENGLQVFDFLVFRYDGGMQFSVKVFNIHGVPREKCFTPVPSSPLVEDRIRRGRSSVCQHEDSSLAQENKRGGSPSKGLATKKRRFVDKQRCKRQDSVESDEEPDEEESDEENDEDRVESDEDTDKDRVESDEDNDEGREESDEDNDEDEVPKKTSTLSSSREKIMKSIDAKEFVARANVKFASRSSSPFFSVTLQPSYLKYNFMPIPHAAGRAYFSDDLEGVKVKTSDGRSWTIGILRYKTSIRLSKGVTCLMNKENGMNLKVGDVCNFKIVKKKSCQLVLRVRVIRH